MAVLTEITVGDPPQVWASMGFMVDDRDKARVGAVSITLTGAGTGITGWRMAGLAGGVSRLDGIAVEAGKADGAGEHEQAGHPNGVTSIDHVVMATPALPRTVDALTAAGLELRRVRDAGRDRSGSLRQQAFFWLGEVILEVVGPAEAAGDGPAKLWGLAFTGDLDRAAATLGNRLRPAKPAVQPGRRIATVDRSAGSSVPIVIMSPHPGDSAAT